MADRRDYDVKDYVDLLAADLEIGLFAVLPDGEISRELKQRIAYYLGRAWDAGRFAALDELTARSTVARR